MKITVKLFATLIRHRPGLRAGDRLTIELPAQSTLADLVTHLALPAQEVKVIFINGRARPPETQLVPDDEVGIFPHIGGG